MGVPQNGWFIMENHGKSYFNGWFAGIPISGNLHMQFSLAIHFLGANDLVREFHIFHDKIPLMLILSCCERPLAKQESMISNIHDGALFRTGNSPALTGISYPQLYYSIPRIVHSIHPIFNTGSQFQRTIINFHIDMHYLRCFWYTMVYGPTKNFQVPKPHGDMTWHDKKKHSDVQGIQGSPKSINGHSAHAKA